MWAIWLLVGYLGLNALFGLVVAVLVVKSMQSPPFRRNSPGQPLSQDAEALHRFWGACTRDPLTDYHIPFSDVAFPSLNRLFTLRGWLIDNRVSVHRVSHANTAGFGVCVTRRLIFRHISVPAERRRCAWYGDMYHMCTWWWSRSAHILAFPPIFRSIVPDHVRAAV